MTFKIVDLQTLVLEAGVPSNIKLENDYLHIIVATHCRLKTTLHFDAYEFSWPTIVKCYNQDSLHVDLSFMSRGVIVSFHQSLIGSLDNEVFSVGHPLDVSQAFVDMFFLRNESFEGLVAGIKDFYSGAKVIFINDEKLQESLMLFTLSLIQPHLKNECREYKQSSVYSEFLVLLKGNYKKHWRVSAYAEALSMTEARLNRLCLKVAEKTARNMIEEKLVHEAKYYLLSKKNKVNEIAYRLGFKDAAYFCRFFKRCTGHSPDMFRKMLLSA